MRLPINQAGDTIVEVLITIAIMGTVLAGAYATANRSLTTIQDAQEHQQATLLAQSQMDALGSLSATDLMGHPNSFCFFNNGSANVLVDALTSPAIPNPQCIQTPPQDYYVSIQQTGIPPAGNLPTYAATVTWDRLGGGQNQVQLFYQPDNQ